VEQEGGKGFPFNEFVLVFSAAVNVSSKLIVSIGYIIEIDGIGIRVSFLSNKRAQVLLPNVL